MAGQEKDAYVALIAARDPHILAHSWSRALNLLRMRSGRARPRRA